MLCACSEMRPSRVTYFKVIQIEMNLCIFAPFAACTCAIWIQLMHVCCLFQKYVIQWINWKKREWQLAIEMGVNRDYSYALGDCLSFQLNFSNRLILHHVPSIHSAPPLVIINYKMKQWTTHTHTQHPLSLNLGIFRWIYFAGINLNFHCCFGEEL